MKNNNLLVVVFIFALLLANPISKDSNAEESFGGLGLEVAQIYDQQSKDHLGPLVVLRILPGTPASRENIENADIITHIDGKATIGKSFDHLIKNELRGPIDSIAKLTIKRMGTVNPVLIELKRVKITYQ